MEKSTLKNTLLIPVFVFILFGLIACNPQRSPTQIGKTPTLVVAENATRTPTFGVTVEPTATPRILTVCTGPEPASLFIYRDNSLTARDIYAAIYDGPIDIIGNTYKSVILEKIPSIEDGDVTLERVDIEPGQLLVDESGSMVNLAEGVTYRPAGCQEVACVQTYSGNEAVEIDQMVVRFRLRPNLTWADGESLTASDSVYAYKIARDQLTTIAVGRINVTSSYKALDERIIEWRGVAGYRNSQVARFFFSPLPEHSMVRTSDSLFSARKINREPLGWGAYRVDEWIAGDHIALSPNHNYFRRDEGLPHFDHLVFRFTEKTADALAALLAGECDLASPAALVGVSPGDLLPSAKAGRVKLAYKPGNAWEHLDFNLAPADPAQPRWFDAREVRQAIEMCIDRSSLSADVSFGDGAVTEVYLPPDHPLYAQKGDVIAYDPAKAAELLVSVGWLDHDQDPTTPRVAAGVSGLPDGSRLELRYTYLQGDLGEQVTQALAESLARCGIVLELEPRDADVLFAPGPEGIIFGRHFELAQFGWTASVAPPCYLYTSSEIAGDYPTHPKGWAGANAPGYSNPEFDAACQQAQNALPGSIEYIEAHQKAQAIFSDDIPSIPLFWHEVVMAMRPDFCGVVADASAARALWDIENFDYGPTCTD